MRFGRTLKRSVYPPWKGHYIEYSKLKKLLRETDSGEDSPARDGVVDEEWTDQDEEAFVQELINVELDKVNAFGKEIDLQLRDRTSKCEQKLSSVVSPGEPEDGQKKAVKDDEGKQKALKQLLEELDLITKEINELEKYCRINFTGFFKAAKKHDRKRGASYKVRPLLQVRLQELPFNKLDYSPLLMRISMLYSVIRQNLDGDLTRDQHRSFASSRAGADGYTSHKFWVHADNLLEVKTNILRRLPVLVYNTQTSQVADGADNDPKITSLYFDNPNFSLYNQKIERDSDASSLRLRWFGNLSEKRELYIEKKTMKQGDDSVEVKLQIKEKYVQGFIQGTYKMEKQIKKLQDRFGDNSSQAMQLKEQVEEIQSFIRDQKLEPMLRANYTRMAFQVPGDSVVRMSLDTDLAFIREDALDDRPCRDPEDWHRRDIDSAKMEWPFDDIRKGEISRFPHALLEIKIKDNASQTTREWVDELTSSHLLKEVPRFSKFVHGVASLFDDQVNNFPFWLPEMENDIRRDPETAFEEEQEKKAKRAEDEFAVGSFFGSSSPLETRHEGKKSSRTRSHAQSRPDVGSTVPSYLGGAGRKFSTQAITPQTQPTLDEEPKASAVEHDSDDDGIQSTANKPSQPSSKSRLTQLFPSFSTSKYAKAQRQRLPPGVYAPKTWLKDAGEVTVEPKVWLANQRTFIKWQHISVLLASLSLGLFNAAGEDNNVARALAIVYTAIAAFAGIWGWVIYQQRSIWIRQRSGKDFDNIFGPIVICIALAVALVVNFGFKVGFSNL